MLKILPVIIIFIAGAGFNSYLLLKTKYPSKGVKVVTNLLKDRMTFHEAIEALKNGKRVRRISETYGYVKVTKEASGYKEEGFVRYHASRRTPEDSRIFLSLEDVMTTDWIVDE